MNEYFRLARILLVLAVSFGWSTIARSATEESFLPRNSMRIGIANLDDSNVTEEEFRDLIAAARSFFRPWASRKQSQLYIHAFWNSDIVNAFAKQIGSTWTVEIHGGLVRHPAMTLDSVALTLCHELGHHFGGLPKKKTNAAEKWQSTEGQADYFANLKCMRHLWDELDWFRERTAPTSPVIVKDECEKNFSTLDQQNLCIRSSMAGYQLTRLLHSIKEEQPWSQFETPDPRRVGSSISGYPSVQCRLDTFFQAALCTANKDEKLDDQFKNKGLCSRKENFSSGNRPRCWYLPNIS